MTLSNFDWTDKTSVKWFLMLPTGHEGPYSLESLLSRELPRETKIWAEGLSSPVELHSVLGWSTPVEMKEEELPPLPPLPPLPESETSDLLPPLPEEEDSDVPEASAVPVPKNLKKSLGFMIGLSLLIIFGLREWVKSQQQFSIRRATRMSPDLFSIINRDSKFDGWNKKIFFKEYVPADMSQIWLVNSGFQSCQVEAQFTSIMGKLLTVKDEKISFRTSGILDDHLVEFSKFDFLSGNKIIPGLYEMDLKASQCTWDGLAATLGNLFKSPQEEYTTRMKVVLYYKGSQDFNLILDKLIRKKLDLEIRNQNQEELFWQDLQQKLQTLVGISMQIEQLLLEFMERPPKDFNANLKLTVDSYTKGFGGILTEFVIQNEKYFAQLDQSQLSDWTRKKAYESSIRLSSKNIGFESMKTIEELQSWKQPTQEDLKRMKVMITKKFALIKDSLRHQLLKVTDDRTK